MPRRPGERSGSSPAATDDYFNVYDEHPDTHIPLEGHQLPMIPEAIELAKRGREIPQMRHVGWDVAITPDYPAIIEETNTRH